MRHHLKVGTGVEVKGFKGMVVDPNDNISALLNPLDSGWVAVKGKGAGGATHLIWADDCDIISAVESYENGAVYRDAEGEFLAYSEHHHCWYIFGNSNKFPFDFPTRPLTKVSQ